MADSPITAEEVRRVAQLARLKLSEDEVARYERDLGAVLGFMRELESLDLTGVDPTEAGVVGTVGVEAGAPAWLRSDDPGASLRRDVVLREAPRVAMAGFAVPAFVDES